MPKKIQDTGHNLLALYFYLVIHSVITGGVVVVGRRPCGRGGDSPRRITAAGAAGASRSSTVLETPLLPARNYVHDVAKVVKLN